MISVEIDDSISHLAFLSSSRLWCDSQRFHSETTVEYIYYIWLELGLGLDLSGL